MQVSNQIDHLVQALNDLRPLLSNDKQTNTDKFAELLKTSLEQSTGKNYFAKELVTSEDKKESADIPHWVNPDYAYDPKKPRKPNMRELVEAISGKSMDKLYNEPDDKWKSVSRNASEVLHGVIGSNIDTRDWQKIMEAEDVLAATQMETGDIYKVKVDIKSELNEEGEIVNQIAVLTDKNNKPLRALQNNAKLAEQTLQNFGATQTSIPMDLGDKIIAGKFDEDLLKFLKNYGKSDEKLEQIALKTSTEIISQQISHDIPLSEYNKL